MESRGLPPVPPGTVPDAEVEIDEPLVRALLSAQHSDLAGLPLRRRENGWDNVSFRLGDDLAVRLPRRASAVELIEKEQTWLPPLAHHITLPVSAPVRVGRPGSGYPWPWSVVRWAEGAPAARAAPAASEAGVVGRFLSELHRLDPPPHAPRNPFRGISLIERVTSVEPRLERLAGLDTGLSTSLDTVWDVWRSTLDVPIDVTDRWLHGDLHPRNIVVAEGRIAAVVDWGDLCAGDPATDLAAAWMLFEPEVHGALWEAYGPVSTDTLLRARGWAVFFGVVLLDSGLGRDREVAAGARITLERVCR